MKDRRTLPRFMQLAASEFLLPGFLWLWMLISGVGLVVALLALAGRTAADTPPAPTWAYAGAAAAYLLLLASILGILREKEAGVPGFLLASVLLYLLNVVTGAPVGEAIRIFVGVIVLLLLLRLDEWQEPDAARIEEGCRAALETEENDSAAALEMYEGLAEQNRDVSPGLVALGALTMPGAFLLAQWLSPRLPWSSGLTQTLLLALIGVGPIVWLFGRARNRLQQRSAVVEGRGERIMTGALVALAMGVLLVVILFSDLLTLAISAIIASLLSLVLVQPYSLYLLITQGPPYHVLPPMSTAARNAIGTAMLLLVLLVVVSEVRLKPIRRALGELGTALQTNWEKIVSFLAALVMLFAFSSTFAESAPFALDVRSALILQALSGALLGYAFSVQVHQPVLDVLIRTGQARCLGATGRRARGLYVAFRLLDSIKSSRVGAAYKWLVSAQIEQLEEQPDPGYVVHCVSEARKQASDRLPYAALFADALERAAGQALGQARPRDGGRATQVAAASHGGLGRPWDEAPTSGHPAPGILRGRELRRTASGLVVAAPESLPHLLAMPDPPARVWWERAEIELCLVPAGEFLMGSSAADARAEEHEKPQHRVYLDAYYVGRGPVTQAQYARFVQAAGHRVPRGTGEEYWWDAASERPPRGKEHHPVVLVSWHDAVAYCGWAGLRLLTEAEWEKAARGTDGRAYPWGNRWDTGRCNSAAGGQQGTTPVGAYSPQGDSPYGCADMAGNVWEWVADRYDDAYYRYSPERNPEGPDSQVRPWVLRGGSWSDDPPQARTAARGRSISLTCDSFGFRCGVSLRALGLPRPPAGSILTR